MVILSTYHGKDKAGSHASAFRSGNAIASNSQQAIEIYLGRVAKKNKKAAQSNQAAYQLFGNPKLKQQNSSDFQIDQMQLFPTTPDDQGVQLR